MTLVEAMWTAESVLGRKLIPDEIALVGQLVHAGKDAADVLTMLNEFVREPDLPDDDVAVHRYESVGATHIQEIP